MNQKAFFLSVMTLLALGLFCSGPAESKRMAYTAVQTALKNGVEASWSCSHQLPDGEYVDITISIADDGKLFDPQIEHSSNDAQCDAECLETVCALSPTMHPNSKRGREITFRFGQVDEKFLGEPAEPGIKPCYDGSDVKEYLLSHQNNIGTGNRIVLIHRIPLKVLRRYPGVFTKDELLNPNNLLKVKVGESGDQQTPVSETGLEYSACIGTLPYVSKVKATRSEQLKF
jgi:hypothetical protein